MDTPIDGPAIDVKALVARQDELVTRWHGEAVAHSETAPLMKAARRSAGVGPPVAPSGDGFDTVSHGSLV